MKAWRLNNMKVAQELRDLKAEREIVWYSPSQLKSIDKRIKEAESRRLNKRDRGNYFNMGSQASPLLMFLFKRVGLPVYNWV